MKIKNVRIQNFRSFKDETMDFDDYTSFVGPNGAGKSTVLCALNIFFREYKDASTDLSKLTIEDFHHKDTSEPIRITVTFNNLSEDAIKTLSHYVRHGELIVTAKASFNDGIAVVKQHGNRMVIKDFSRFHDAVKSGANVGDLKSIYRDLSSLRPELGEPSTKANMVSSLELYESSHSGECELTESDDQFYGFTKGANKLDKYIQWVFLPAVKNAAEESIESNASALGKLLERTVRSRVNFDEKLNTLKKSLETEYQDMLDEHQGSLEELSNQLDSRLKYWVNSAVDAKILWEKTSEKAVKIEKPYAHIQLGESGFKGNLSRFGHGLQRSYVLALLHELSQQKNQNEMPTLVLAIEEPELYQHPPQAKHLAYILQQMAGDKNQIFLCTHSPLFIDGSKFESVRMIRSSGSPSRSKVGHMKLEDLSKSLSTESKPRFTDEGMMAKINQALRPAINEMYFSNILIILEGYEDLAYIQTYLLLKQKMDDFRARGCYILPVGGKSEIPKVLAIANHLKIPSFVVFDADSDTKEDNGRRELHRKDNKLILKLLGRTDIEEFPDNDCFESNFVMWSTNLGNVVKEINNWQEHRNSSNQFFGHPPGGLEKNELAIGYALERSWSSSDFSPSLNKLIENMFKFIESHA